MRLVAILLSTLGLLSSAFFCWLSFLYISQVDGDVLAIAGGVISAVYGMTNALLIGGAWLRPIPHMARYSQWTALVFALLYLLACLDSGMVSGLEFLSFLALSVVLFINCMAVSRAAAQQVNPAGSPTGTA